MKIANFREYTSVLRELYTGEAFAETGNYYYALMSSGKELNQAKADLQNKIKVLNQQIQLQAQKIRECEDKKRAGLEANKLKQNKQTLVKELKALQAADHFNMLSEDAKICVCSGFLFQKYLTSEIIQNNPLHFPTDDNGDLIVNPEQLRHSEIYEQAQHIKDFVAAYIARYPEKVKTAGHFKTLLNSIDNWQNLLAFVNDNFDKLKDTTELLPDNIKNSRKDTEVVLTFPQENLLLVKLKSATALDYETAKMDHCVGKGGYDKQVANGQTEIYSLRSIEPDGEWLPHGTIEFKDGKIAQVKGKQNKKIEDFYVSAIRKSIFHLCQNDNIYELFQQRLCSDLRNLKFFTPDYIPQDSDILWSKFAPFLEGFCVSKMLHNHVITIKDCTNMPQGEDIKLPQDIKHFMLGLPQKEKYQLPDFRAYPNLESLQINNLDLSDNKVIYLPQEIKYRDC